MELSPERVRALNAWAASLAPQDATRVRSIARNCGNCVHYDAGNPRHVLGLCRAAGPSMTAGVESWPQVAADERCGRWNHPSLPLNYLSGLSPVELERAARAMGAEVAGG